MTHFKDYSMKTFSMQYKTLIITGCLLLWQLMTLSAENRAVISYTENAGAKSWSMENDVMKFEFSHSATGAIISNSFYNKEAAVEYLRSSGSQLFNYSGQFIATTETTSLNSIDLFTYRSADTNWSYIQHDISDIKLSSAIPQLIGKKLQVVFEKTDIRLTLVFEMFDGKSGLRYQTLIKNKRNDARMVIEKSDVISFNIQNKPHNLHYVTNINWLSTNAVVEEAPINNKGKDVAKCLLNLYSTNDGWYIAPEVNWKTQYGPEIPTDQGYEYMHRSYAGATAWAAGSSFIKVVTSPEAFQLILFPGEEFEYIPVNMTVFKGDIVDGKMAVEEHLRKRFRFNNTSTTFVVNDWDWFTQGLRNETFYKDVVIPLTKAAGYEMIMFDDGWNNPNATGTGLNNDGLSRDPVEAHPIVISDMQSFTQYIADQGIQFGLWYSMTGGHHNKGRDLAQKSVVDAKKAQIEYMINNYHMAHQAVDLTQYWQNTEETADSHPSDNVYRKNVLTRNMMNELVDKYPQYVVKVTSELDIYPTQGDRNVDLGHLPNNGWITITGANSGAEAPAILFGHMPLNSVYVGGGNPTGNMADYYSSMSARNVKVPLRPDRWDANGVTLMGKFNKWRRSDRIKAMTELIMRPVYFGENWTSPVASNWNVGKGPYLWMHVDKAKNKALLVGTTAGKNLGFGMTYPIRWLDEAKTYLVQDITLDETGIFTYNFLGKYTGSELNQNGLAVRFHENSSGGKALWIQALQEQEKQVLYASEDVITYTETLSGNQLTITATGKPDTSGKVIVYGKTENDAMIVNIAFNSQGNGSAVVTNIVNNNVPYPGYASDVVYQMKDFHEGLIKSNENIYVTEVDNGLGRNDKSSYVRMTELNDFVIYPLEVPFSGTCKVTVNYKISRSSRGVAQLFLVDQNENETPIGPSFDQSSTTKEEMNTLDLGNIQLNGAGRYGIKMKLVGPGVSGTGNVLTLNYISIGKNK